MGVLTGITLGSWSRHFYKKSPVALADTIVISTNAAITAAICLGRLLVRHSHFPRSAQLSWSIPTCGCFSADFFTLVLETIKPSKNPSFLIEKDLFSPYFHFNYNKWKNLRPFPNRKLDLLYRFYKPSLRPFTDPTIKSWFCLFHLFLPFPLAFPRFVN